jgi:thioredoxin 1
MRRPFQLFALLVSFWSSAALAAEQPYTAAAFQKLIAAHQPLAVVLHADWCPTCRAQAPVLKELAGTPEFRNLTILIADFDSEKALRQTLNASQQSTVVTFSDGREAARATGYTDRDKLASLLRTALTPPAK